MPIAREGTALRPRRRRRSGCSCSAGSPATPRSPTCGSADLSRPGRPRWEQLCSPTSCGAGPSAALGRPRRVRRGRPNGSSCSAALAGSGMTANDVWALDLAGDADLAASWPRPVRAQPPAGARPTATTRSAGGSSCSAGRPGPTRTGTPLQDSVGAVPRRPAAAGPELATTGPGGRRPDAARRPPSASDGGRGRADRGHGADDRIDRARTTATCGRSISAMTSARWVELASDAAGRRDRHPRRSASAVHDPSDGSPRRGLRPRRHPVLRRDVGVRPHRPDLAPSTDLTTVRRGRG